MMTLSELTEYLEGELPIWNQHDRLNFLSSVVRHINYPALYNQRAPAGACCECKVWRLPKHIREACLYYGLIWDSPDQQLSCHLASCDESETVWWNRQSEWVTVNASEFLP